MGPIKKRSSIRARASASTNPAKSTRDAISHPNSTHLPVTTTASSTPNELQPDTSALRPSKKQKSQLRHANLLQKVRDGGISKRDTSSDGGVKKRRRPGKKIAAVEGLAGLGDALPDLEGDDEWEGLSDTGTDDEMGDGAPHDGDVDAALPTGMRKAKRRRGPSGGNGGEGKVVMKSLKHRPGAMKRKRALEVRETERMRGNLVQMAQRRTGSTEGGGGEGVSVGSGVGGDMGAQGASQAERWKALRAFIGGTMETSGEFGGKK